MSDAIGDRIADPNFVTDLAAYDALFTDLRAREPLRWTEPSNTRPFWMVCKHADILEVERKADIFLSGPRLELRTLAEEADIKAATGGREEAHRTMLHMDGEDHRAYRGLSQSWFMPNNLKKLTDELDGLATEYVDRLAACGSEADFVEDFALWFPLRVIMMILGLPATEERHLLKITQDFVGRAAIPLLEGETREQVPMRVTNAVFTYFGQVYQDRIARPRDDLATVVAQARIKGAPIQDLEALSYYLLIGLAGHETTSSTIAGGMMALIDNPDQLAALRADPQLVPGAIDEMLRWTSPTKAFMRTAASDYELRGKTIRKGDGLMLCYQSGNRDEAVFDDAFKFRIDRKPNPHLSFGYGPHLCLGQHLAKMEMKALFNELIPRLVSIERAGKPVWGTGITSSGLTRLPVRLQLRESRQKLSVG